MDQERRKPNNRRGDRSLSSEQMKWLKIGLGVTLSVTVICCFVMLAAVNGWLFFGQTPAAPSEPVMESQPQPETEPAPTLPPVPDQVIHLIAGGDVNITDKTVAAGQNGSGYDYSKLFMDVIPTLGSGDVSLLNFEGTLYDAPYGKASAPKELVQALQKAGVDILQTANSRCIERGTLGLSSTLSGIRGAGIVPVGTFGSQKEFDESKGYTLMEIAGIRIAFVAFTKGMDGMLAIPKGDEHCVNLLYEDYYNGLDTTFQKINTAGIKSVMKSVRAAKPDVTVALVHWGSTDNDNISKTQKKICTLLQEEGADAILGTHSHRVQQMVFDEAAGTFVAYSLGDFMGDGIDEAAYSVLLDLQITKSAKTGQVKITGFDYVPIYQYWEGDSLRILRAAEAVEAYEQNAIGKVSEEAYLAMKSALADIDKRIHAKVP